jgi:hypothetical protein
MTRWCKIYASVSAALPEGAAREASSGVEKGSTKYIQD